MLAYMVRRLLWTPVLLLLVSLFVFVLGQYGPGDPVEVRLGQNYTPERAERLRQSMGLDDPFYVQFGRYVGNALRGDFGESYQFPGRRVSDVLGPRLWVSIQLNAAAFMITLTFGVPLGFYAATRQGRWADPAVVLSTLILYALPVFLTGPVLIIIFALNLGWTPTSGWGGFFDSRIILPAVAIGVPGIAVFTRLMRASTLDVLGQEYIRTARSKGLQEAVVSYRHVARNALLPVLTVTGFALAGLFGGSLIVELIFGIPGVGRMALDSIFSRDYPVIMALVLISATMLVLANLLIDVLYSVVDPRIRLR